MFEFVHNLERIEIKPLNKQLSVMCQLPKQVKTSKTR